MTKSRKVPPKQELPWWGGGEIRPQYRISLPTYLVEASSDTLTTS